MGLLDLKIQLEKELQSIEEKQQNVRILRERINSAQTILGLDKVRDGNIFDDQLPPKSDIVEEDFGSPGADTLVDPQPDAVSWLPMSKESPTLPLSDPLDPDLQRYTDNTDDVLMGDPISDQLGGANDHTSAEVRKRKRFSRQISSKKVRIEAKAKRSNTLLAPPSANESTNAESYGDRIGGAASHMGQLDDGTKPSYTTRPTSWPRNRLFRRSAGVSVRKLTEVFEKICLPQDKP